MLWHRLSKHTLYHLGGCYVGIAFAAALLAYFVRRRVVAPL